ncbi:MAG: ROK family transcriptional regulator [Dermatophilaceae bacterium]|nr:ROK family transcriptional regulator [Dermatophilaceae bacterium]
MLAHLLAQRAAVTRPEIAKACELSRPTVLAAVERLEQTGLVIAVGQRSGLPGRSASLYEVSREAGMVAGLDIGGSNLRVALTDARGVVLAEMQEPTTVTGGLAVAQQGVRLVRRVLQDPVTDGRRLSAIGVSIPGVVGPDGATVHYAWNVGQPEPFDFHSVLAQALEVPVLLDNNVNLAALGEQRQGAAQHLSTFAVIAVGAGVGAGIVHQGQLLRGAHGGAGEVAFLPTSQDYRRPEAGAPDEAGGVILLRTAQSRGIWDGRGAPASVEELFQRAAAGDRTAREIVEEESRRIAVIAASISAVVDPEAILLTGGVGANEMLVAQVATLVEDFSPFSTPVLRSGLGARASLVGALHLGVTFTQQALLAQVGDSRPSSDAPLFTRALQEEPLEVHR